MKKLSRGAYEDTKGLVRAAETLLEVVVMTLLYYAAFRKGYDLAYFAYKGKYVLMGIYAVLLYVFFLNSDCTLFGELHMADLMIGQIISLFVVNLITYFQLCLIANAMISVTPVLLLFLAEILAAWLLVFAYTELYYKMYVPHDMLLVFGTKRGIGLKIKMDSRRDKYNISKLISIDEGLEAVCQEARKHDAVILTDIPAQMRNDILKYCYRYRIRTYVAPKLTDIMLRGAKNNTLFDTPLLMVKSTGLSPMQRVIKRTMDLVLCGIAMIPAAPIMAVVALAIKLEDGGPVFYRQKRLTRGGREFEILKFRSMRVDAEKDGVARFSSGDHDDRITPVGKVIRACRIDELPQLVNILKGELSIVGPRPERPEIAAQYCEEMPEFSLRLQAKAGLTGYAQIYGKYNTTPYDKLVMDLMYIAHPSIVEDLKIMFATVKILFMPESTEGVSEGQTTAMSGENH